MWESSRSVPTGALPPGVETGSDLQGAWSLRGFGSHGSPLSSKYRVCVFIRRAPAWPWALHIHVAVNSVVQCACVLCKCIFKNSFKKHFYLKEKEGWECFCFFHQDDHEWDSLSSGSLPGLVPRCRSRMSLHVTQLLVYISSKQHHSRAKRWWNNPISVI